MLTQKYALRNRAVLSFLKRGFAAGGHGHDDHHDDHCHGDHGHDDHGHDDHGHGDHGHDDHHHHIEKADLDHKFIAQQFNKKTLVFDRLKPS